MKRRQMLLSAAAVIAAPITIPIEAARTASNRVRLWAVRHGDGWTDAFCESVAEAKTWQRSAPDRIVIHPVEFIPTGKYLVFQLLVEDMENYIDPRAVPEGYELPAWAGDTITRPADEWMPKQQAIEEMIGHNLMAMRGKSDRWCVAVELGEEIEVVSHTMEFATGEFAVVSTMTYRPARIYRHGEVA